MTKILRHEHGFALPMALGIIMVLGILSIAASSFMLSNGEHAVQSRGGLQALQYAEGGLDAAYSLIWNANANGQDPTAGGLVGTAASPKVFCLITGATCTGTYVPGTASVFGCYGGTTGTTCNGTAVAPSTWLLVSTGYGPGGSSTARTGRTMMSTVFIHPLNSGAVAALWNHIFLTAPLVPNVCQTSFTKNNMVMDAPLYSFGNVCLIGSNDEIIEQGQPVDVMIGGKLILSGPNTRVGADAGHPITSGVVVGGCNTTGVANATSPCGNGTFNYWVTNSESFISQDAPVLTNAQIEQHFTNDDPGPKHTCLAGTNPAPLADNQLDYNVAGTEGVSTLPDTSGSGSSGGTFTLTPNSSYACISKDGTSVGYLIWNNGNSSITVSGVTVPAKTLAVNGSIFFDSNVSVTQSALYTGTAVLTAAGTISFGSNGASLCAVANCTSTNWQGTTGNNSMLTLASLAASSSAIAFSANNNSIQGSLYTLPTAGVDFSGSNNAFVQGPMSIGTINLGSNNPQFNPLPVIKNMPVGAPLPPNTGVTIDTMTVVK
jgi:Tfp pilus assembly protein PilX